MNAPTPEIADCRFAICDCSASQAISDAARRRMLVDFGEPFLLADWLDVLMVHLEVDPVALQRATPFRLDCRAGRAYVSLVFFLLHRMRPRRGGRVAEWLLRPIATHPFLNVRTYVEHAGETGIYFLAEWLPNILSVHLGPTVFGLPYRHGHFVRRNRPDDGTIEGAVVDAKSEQEVTYEGRIHSAGPFVPCGAGSLEEWLMERYTAFTSGAANAKRGYFRVWHPPWPQVPAEVQLHDDALLRHSWPWMAEAECVGASYSPGIRDVWMGRPRAICGRG